MTILYLDESGEEGFKPTSSEWFVLGGAFHKDPYGSVVKKHYQAYKEQHHRGQDNWYFHFQTASHNERRGFIKHMGELDYVLASVAIHKPSLRNPENLRKKYYLYFYATRMLLEAVTKWMLHHEPKTLKIIFSSRKGLSVDNFADYLTKVRSSPFVKHDYVKWKYVDPYNFESRSNRELIGLQMADCFASSLAQAVEFNDHAMTECRYIRELSHRFMRLNQNWVGYGVKMWPFPSSPLYRESRFDWCREVR